MTTAQQIVWRHLHQQGHDACRLVEQRDGWLIEGMAAFIQGAEPGALAYRVRCDRNWLTLDARVEGWIGRRGVELEIFHEPLGRWIINGEPQPVDDDVVDLDLGFTPATNILPIRRLGLKVDETVPAPAAYLELPAMTLLSLAQTYRRIDAQRIHYASPRHNYQADLVTSRDGFVIVYPGLFEACAPIGDDT